MESEQVKEQIREIRHELVQEKILHPKMLDKPVEAAAAHEDFNNNWNHLMLSFLFKS